MVGGIAPVPCDASLLMGRRFASPEIRTNGGLFGRPLPLSGMAMQALRIDGVRIIRSAGLSNQPNSRL